MASDTVFLLESSIYFHELTSIFKAICLCCRHVGNYQASLDCVSVLAATTLCAFHYIVCTLSIWLTQALGGVKAVKLPINGMLLCCGIFCVVRFCISHL